MVLDVRANLLVDLLQKGYVLKAVPCHLPLSDWVSVYYLCPKIKTFMLELATSLQKRADESQFIRDKPKLLNSFVNIDTGDRRKRLQSSEKELPVEFRKIEPIPVIRHNSISFGHKSMDFFQHSLLAVFPFREQVRYSAVHELHADTKNTAILNDLVETNILVPQPPHIGFNRCCLNI